MSLDMCLNISSSYSYDNANYLPDMPSDIKDAIAISENNRVLQGYTKSYNIGYWRNFHILDEYISNGSNSTSKQIYLPTYELAAIIKDLKQAYDNVDDMIKLCKKENSNLNIHYMTYNEIAYSILVFEKALELSQNGWNVEYFSSM